MKKMNRQTVVINVFGAIGYVLLVSSWALFMAVIIALLLDSSLIALPTNDVEQNVKATPTEPSPLLLAASYAVTGIMVIASAMIFITLPYFIGKKGAMLLRQLMLLLGIDITRRQLFLMKSILATIPLIGLMGVNLVLTPDSISFAAMYIAVVLLSAGSIGVFFLQLLLARRVNLPVDETW